MLPQLAVVAHLVAPTASSTTSASDVEAAAMSAAHWFVDLEVVPAASLRGALGRDLRACGADNRCASARLVQHGIDRAIYVVANLGTGVLTVEVVNGAPPGVIATELTQLTGDVEAAIEASVRSALIRAGHRLGGRLVVELTPADASARIGTSSIASSSPVVLPAGTHTLEASLSGFETERRELVLAPGREVTLRLTLEEEAGVLSSWWLWTIVGAVAAAAIAVPLAVRFSEGETSVCTARTREECGL